MDVMGSSALWLPVVSIMYHFNNTSQLIYYLHHLFTEPGSKNSTWSRKKINAEVYQYVGMCVLDLIEWIFTNVQYALDNNFHSCGNVLVHHLPTSLMMRFAQS